MIKEGAGLVRPLAEIAEILMEKSAIVSPNPQPVSAHISIPPL